MDTIYPWWWDEREFPRRAVMTEWFYNPLKGQPRYVDIYRLRSLAASEWIFMCTSTIIEEIAQVPWEVVPKDPKLQESPPEQILNEIDEVNYFLNNPNDNKGETINTIFRAMLRDSLELDAGCIVKGFSESSYERHPAGGFELRPQGERMLLEIFARDGGSFLKETDVNGIEYRLWQYSYLHPAVAPIEFDVNEVVYAMRYPRSYGVYGWSEIQSAETILNLLINSAFTNATMFQEYAVPSGVISFTGSKEDEDRLREYFRTEIKGRFHKVAVLNKEAKFVPLAYTARDLEFLKGQEWFAKLVWALYKLTPTEMGFQDEIRETGKAMAAQGRIQKRKAVFPLLRLIEQVMNNQVINEFSPRIKFQFNFVDKEEEYADTQLEMQELSAAMMTINEWRKKRKIGPPVPWGDKPLAITLAEMRGPSGFGGAPSAGAPKPPTVPSPGQDTLRQFTADEKASIEATKAWGARGQPSYDFEDKADRAAPVYTWDQTGKQVIQVADTQSIGLRELREMFRKEQREHPEFTKEQIWQIVEDHVKKGEKQYARPETPARGPYAGHGKPHAYPMGAMGSRPDEPRRVGTLLGGENPEEIQRAREVTRERPHRVPLHSGGMGAHRWERDETNRIAMGTQVSKIARDQLAPPRRTTDPVTDVESRIVPTPPIRAGPIKYPRDVPPVEMATAPGGVGPQRESLGFLEAPSKGRFMNKQLPEGAPEHTHSTAFRGPVKAELSLARKLTSILRKFRKGILSRDQALSEGRKAIDANQLRILEIARKRASKVVGKEILELAPEVTSRLEGIRTQGLSDFQRIIDDSR